MNGQDKSDRPKGQPGIRPAALFGLCPRCGERTLFAGATKFADRCRNCELDFTRFNVGDGPAAFLTMIVGAVIVGLALWLDFAVHPPFWLHALIWIPVTTGAVIWGLRVSKAALLTSEYRNNAREAGSKDL
ncbi:MAG: hypothetical protein C0510_08915 [Erythrobacter sp.]|nr:hypothetical protein [Erythrobacter sp.]